MRTALAKLVLYGSALLPLSLAHGIGAIMGRLFYLIPNRHRHISAVNIGLCFPELDRAQRKQLLCQSLMELGKSVFETGALWRWRKDRALKLTTRISGEELVTEALARGKGVILAVPHLGAWEDVGVYCSAKYPMTSMYRPPKLQSLDGLVRQARERLGATLVPTDASGVRALYRALQRNELVAILPDQDPGEAGAVFAPFFGHAVRTMTLVSRLTQKAGATVIFCYAERLAKGAGFHIHFRSAAPGIDDDDPVRAGQALNEGIEACVRGCPAQYQWSYKRFKNRPEGQASPY
jgi:KDO2-lipid IV(A) lauroyltransferase